MKKRIIAFLLAAVLLLGLMPTALAAGGVPHHGQICLTRRFRGLEQDVCQRRGTVGGHAVKALSVFQGI